MHDILNGRMLPITAVDVGLLEVSLPDLLALYGRNAVVAHSFLRPHQRHAWHAFCVQLAALALHHAAEATVEHDAPRWRDLLRGLTAAWPDDEPWRLVVDDLARPAFMQPPVPEGTLAGFRNEIATPDDLDILVTSKNHGIKQAQGLRSGSADWAAALVSLQTTGGFAGRDTYGVARMNRGFATRPGIGLVPEGGPGARWRRDVTLLLCKRDWFFERVPQFRSQGGSSLLWCLPWDGSIALELADLDPWFVEICRRVRLVRGARGALSALATPTKVARIAAAPFKGNLADPWTPINRERDSVAYNSLPTYAVISEVLFDRGRWVRPLLLDWHPEIDAAPMTARFDVFARGQGKTEGYHERVVPMSERRLRRFSRPADSDRLAELAKGMIQDVRALLGPGILRTALLSLVQGGREQVKCGDRTAGAWADTFLTEADREIDRCFFDHLFARADDEEAGRRQWLEFLRELGRATFEQAVMAAPLVGTRRPRAIAVAERILWDRFHRTFPELSAAREETANAA